MPVIVITTDIRAPIQRCFDLARSIDFHRRSMAHSGEEAIAGTTSGLIGPGQSVTWRARHLGVRQTLQSRIVAFEPPHLFADEQVRGAFASFRHEHRFEPLAPDPSPLTRLTDHFTFVAPYGPLGRLVESLFLTAYMSRLLRRHADNLKAALESDAWRPFLEAHAAPTR